MECISYRERDSLTDLLCLTLGELHETFSSTDIVDMGAKLWKAIVNIKISEFTLIHDIFTKYPSRNLIRFYHDIYLCFSDSVLRFLQTSTVHVMI
jgi:hypothetical protein